MRQIGISGSWRTVNQQVNTDVRQAVRRIVESGDRIVTGGALGVDWIATDEAIHIAPDCEHIRIILPTPFPIYRAHFFNRAAEGVITKETAQTLIDQLQVVWRTKPTHLEQMSYSVCTPETYYARNQRVIDISDELLAFHVNKSEGVQDTIDRAYSQGKKVTCLTYTI